MSSPNRLTEDAVIGRGRILTGAMILGVLLLVVAALLLGPLQPDSGLTQVFRIILVVLAGSSLLVPPLVRNVALTKLKQDLSQADAGGSEEITARAYLASLVLGNALIEGVGLLAGVSALLTGDWLGLAVALGAAVLLFYRLPSRSRYRALADSANQPWD